MQGRHRMGPGNGYRSNCMVMRGVAAASRISPEGMVRGNNRFYNSEHRNQNRGGYGRGGGGQSRQVQPSNHHTDIFVEAGKLAAEYLVSKGLLPPNALSGKWQNSFHLGNSAALDVGPSRREYRGRRGNRPFRNSDPEGNKELGRSGSLDEKSRSSNSGTQALSPGEITQESDGGNSGAKASSSDGKNQKSDAGEETIKGSDNANKFHEEAVKEMNEEQNKEATFENVPIEALREQDVVNDENSTERKLDVHQNHEVKSLESDVLDVPAVEKELNVTYSTIPEQSSGSESFPVSTVMERGEKRVMDEEIDCRESFKKLREWVPSDSMESEPALQEPTTSHGTPSPEQKTVNLPYEFMQEKQLFPGSSFKTCDLNLIGNCDNINENRDAKPPEEVRPIDIDLSMNNNNNFNLPMRNVKHGINDSDIEVIDLESDSAREDKAFSNPERRGDTVFSYVDGFRNNVHNANEIPGVQDGYGLMISELLGNNSPNCSSVQTNLNPLDNDVVALPNGEGILGDDDSIYMSLEEIPISFLGSWEQPTQDYEKPF